MGKTVGDDFREGKVTLPVILAYQAGGDEERGFWHRTIETLEQEEPDLARAQALLDSHRALSDTVERARSYGALAKEALSVFPDSTERRALSQAIDFAIERAY